MLINDYIRRMARVHPEKKAILFKDESISYGTLHKKTRQMAGLLREKGLVKGDRVGVLMPNCIENVLSLLSILELGCIEVQPSMDLDIPAMIDFFEKTEISGLILKQIDSQTARTIISAFPFLRVIVLNSNPTAGDSFTDMEAIDTFETDKNAKNETVNETDYALIQHTSGSTGRPKGVVLTQRNFISASLSWLERWQMGENARLLNLLPLSHSCSKSLVFASLVKGITLVLSNGFVSPLSFLKTIKKNRVTIITGPPFIFYYLLKLKGNQIVLDELKDHLKCFEIGLSSVSPRLIHDLKAVFPWITVVIRYGLTENAGAAASMYHYPDKEILKPESCGKPGSINRVEISKENGEIVIRGDNVMAGYWEDIQLGRFYDYATRGFPTGDIGEKDMRGYLYIKGRKDEMIKINGYKVYPPEIEKLLQSVLNTDAVAVFSEADTDAENRIVACYRSEAENMEQRLVSLCREKLPSHAVPQKFIRIEEPFPMNSNGKINKRKLVEQIKAVPERPGGTGGRCEQDI